MQIDVSFAVMGRWVYICTDSISQVNARDHKGVDTSTLLMALLSIAESHHEVEGM